MRLGILLDQLSRTVTIKLAHDGGLDVLHVCSNSFADRKTPKDSVGSSMFVQ